MKSIFFSVVVALLFFSCETKKVLSAQNIVDKAIEASGGEHRNDKMVDFDFRDKHYKSILGEDGYFHYQREFKDSLIVIKDVINNKGFQRYADDFPIAVPDTMAIKYQASVNSVHYFVQLPLGLNESAVNKSLLDNENIKGTEYHKIKVTFNEEGGGEDFEDIFVYWIHSETFKVAYLAYSYNESDGLGIRFREAYNERYVRDIRFVDYNNYKPNNNTIPLEDLGQLFEKGKLNLLSKIETENVVVNQLVNNN